MERINKHRDLIKKYIDRHVEIFGGAKLADVEEIAVFDDERGHYQWLSVGWKNGERNFYTHLYVRLRDNKIYIEEDWTEEGIGNYLVENGVPKKDIVLAFQEPEMRKYTEFAVA